MTNPIDNLVETLENALNHLEKDFPSYAVNETIYLNGRAAIADYKQLDGGQYTLRHDEGNFIVEDFTGGLFCVLKYVGVNRAEFILNTINSTSPATKQKGGV